MTANTKAIVALNHSTNGGVYVTTNLEFEVPGTQPTWTKLATTGLANTLIRVMQNDTYNPYGANGIYIQLDNGNVYVWSGSAWTEIMTPADASTLVVAQGGAAGGTLGEISIDASVSGTLYIPYVKTTTALSAYFLKTTDYGASWTATLVTGYTGVSAPARIVARGQNVIYSTSSIYPSLYFSTSGGGGWVEWNAWPTSSGGLAMKQDPHNPTNIYAQASAGDEDLTLYTSTSATQKQNGLALGEFGNFWSDLMWIDPLTAGHHRIFKNVDTNDFRIYYTSDAWATVNSPSALTGVTNTVNGYHCLVAALENNSYMMFGLFTGADDAHPVYAMDGEATGAAWHVSGTNTDSGPGYTDSIPTVADGYVAKNGIFVGEAPADSGILVYSVEFDAFDTSHSPMKGDRGSWKTEPVNTWADYHAQDIQENTPHVHVPWDSATPPASGTAPVSDGSKWVATDIATQAELNTHAGTPAAHHDPVTLAADADVLLGLSTQQLTLDTQAANTFLGGPTSGAAADPTFRTISLEHLLDVLNSMAPADNDILSYDGGLALWRNKNPNQIFDRAWGSMYQDDSATVITVAATDTDYIVDGMSSGILGNVTFDNTQELVIEIEGVYEVNWSVSFVTAAANQEIEGAVGVNGVRDASTSSHARINTATDDTAIGGTGLLSLVAGDLVQIVVRNETGTNNITVDHANLSIVFLGLTVGGNLLLETGDALLLETGDNLLTES